MSSKGSLTKEEKKELIQILELLELEEDLFLKKQKAGKGARVKKQKQKPQYVNQLQKNIAKQFDINIPKPVPKSISKSYGK